MSDITSNRPTRLSNTDNTDEGVSNLTAHISKLEAAEERTRDMINRISSLLRDILEPQAHNVSEKQKVGAKQKNSEKRKVGEKRIEITASIKILNKIREQSRYGYSILYTLWKQMGDVQGKDENEEIAGQVRELNQKHERNRERIVALWREVRDLHKEVKLTGDKGERRGLGNAPSDSWEKSADDSWGTAAADANAVANTQETSNTATDACETTEAPAAEASVAEAPYAPSKIVFKSSRCVTIVAHRLGHLDSLRSLGANDNADNWALCSLHMGVLKENREVSLFLRATFPQIPSTNDPSGGKFQHMNFNFYGDAFQNIDNDFVITPVNYFHELPGPLKNHQTVIRLTGKCLHKLQLIYQPEKVMTKGKDDPLAFPPSSCSWPANAFRGLVRHGDPKTLNLYFRAQDRELEALHALKERLRVEKDIRPFEE